MDRLTQLNGDSWNEGAARYSALVHSEKMMKRLLGDPKGAFAEATWRMIEDYAPPLAGLTVLVPSSGDNHAVFAFAMLGAYVTSCDIVQNQLDNARRVASAYDWGARIRYLCCDTRTLAGVEDGAYDLVYTSNGVHVWIDDLDAMYASIRRALKPGGLCVMYDIHPFQRPFDDSARIVKPYDLTGPFDDGNEVTFTWRVMDLQNAMLGAGLRLLRVEAFPAEKDYDWPFMLPLEDKLKGKTLTREDVDRLHDWRQNPMAALPNWISMAARA